MRVTGVRMRGANVERGSARERRIIGAAVTHAQRDLLVANLAGVRVLKRGVAGAFDSRLSVGDVIFWGREGGPYRRHGPRKRSVLWDDALEQPQPPARK